MTPTTPGRQHGGRRPALLRPFRQRVEHERQARRRTGRTRAGRTRPAVPSRCSRRNSAPITKPNDADRQVDVEDPAPRDVGDEPTADDRPERGREHGRDDQHRRRLGPLQRRERAEQHRGADRRQHAAADALQHAERDELVQAVRLPAERRREREHREREEEHLLRADPVADPARRRDPDRERQQIPEHDPLDRGRAGVRTRGRASASRRRRSSCP